MSLVFVDTSAFFALLMSADRAHQQASQTFRRLQELQASLVTSSYVLVETYALLGRRAGLAAVRGFRDGFEDLLETVWVDEGLHERGLDLLLERKSEQLSLVDATSFLVIRERDADRVFAFDRHFEQEGFTLLN